MKRGAPKDDGPEAALPRLSSRPPGAHADADETRLTRTAGAQLLDATQRDKAYLIIIAGSNVGEMFRLHGETIIGRAVNATIRLQDDGISRRHAKLLVVAGEVVVEDLGSANGTFVNSELITRRALHDGDKIRLGSTTILKFTYHDRLDESFQHQMYDAATRDALTAAYNRKFFVERLGAEIAYARRHRTDLSLLMLDVDHFKRVNDGYGHLAGDVVLAKLAQVARATLRAEDVFARHGGEEFAVICRGASLDMAANLAERLRALVESTEFTHEGQQMSITVSIGVAAHAVTAVDTIDQMIAAADQALYDAKRAGRNRVALSRAKP